MLTPRRTNLPSFEGLFRRRTKFQGLWHGPPLGSLRTACLTSFTDKGYNFELYTYERIEVPRGVRLRDAAQIIPRKEIFYYANLNTRTNDLGPFSDLFRFKLLSERGGWWTDVDTICLSPDIPPVDRAWARESPEFSKDAIGTSQIAFPKGDAVVCKLYQDCKTISQGHYPARESLGPHLLSSTIKNLGVPKDVFGSSDTFYPVRWIEMFKLWLPQFREDIESRLAKAYFLPIYQSFPQLIGLSLGHLPPKGSYLERFCEKLGINEGQHYTEREVLEATQAFFRKSSPWPMNELQAVCGDRFVIEFFA